MKRTLQAGLLLLTGAGVLRVSLFSDIVLRYVKAGLQPYVIASGVCLMALGLTGAARDRPGRDGPAEDGPGHEHEQEHVPEHEHGHDHSHGPRIAWLLLLPALALLFHAPPALGSYTAARDNAKVVEDYDRFDPLPAHGPRLSR